MPGYSHLSDFDLMYMIKEGDHLAYREIYSRYTPTLYYRAYQKLQNREEARDLVHEVFSMIWIKRDELILQSNVGGYLYHALRNKILNLIEKKKNASRYFDSLQQFIDHNQAETDHLIRENQLMELINKEIQELPPKMKAIFELSRKKHLSHREISQALGVSEKTVRNQINNALKILRIKLGLLTFLYFIFFY